MTQRSRVFRIGVCVIGLLLMVAGWVFVVDNLTIATHSIAYGTALPVIPHTNVQPLGISTDLFGQDDATIEQSLTLLEQGGFTWVRQPFHWRDAEAEQGTFQWEQWDRLVERYRAHGLQIIAILDQPPEWARRDKTMVTSPPTNVEDFGLFVAAFATHYRGSINHLQIWEEPNIFPNWGNRWVDPGQYADLLKEANKQAKIANSDSVILTAGLAPNLEPGGTNMSDILYLQELYRFGIRGNFDILAAKPYGMSYSANDRQPGATTLGFSRVELLHEVMMKNGDANTPVWAVEFGWDALPIGWQGQPSVWGQINEQEQATETVSALQRAQQEWPWMGVMCLRGFLPWANPDDPAYGFSIVDRGFQPKPVYVAVQELAELNLAGVGYHYAKDPRFEWLGEWTDDGEQKIGRAGSQAKITFKGNQLDLLVRQSPPGGKLAVKIDGAPAYRLPYQDGAGLIDLAADQSSIARLTVADGLSDGTHQLEVTVLPNQENTEASKAALQGVVVVREPLRAPSFLVLVGMLTIGVLCVYRLVVLATQQPSVGEWAQAQWQVLGQRLGVPVQEALVLLVGGGGVAAACLASDLRLAALGGLVTLAVIWLDIEAGPALLLFSLPFYLVPFQFVTNGNNARPIFSPVEVLILLSMTVLVAQYVLIPSARARFRLVLGWNELAVLLFIIIGIIGVLVAAQPKESLREFRTIIFEPALVYFLFTTVVREKGLRRALSFFFIGAVAISLIGLYQYLATSDVITAEGVRRIKAFYGSPNNLSLYLGRVIPLAACMGLWSGIRRWHLGGLAVMVVTQALTFSVGGWLGLLAAALFIGVLKGRRVLATAVGALGVALVAAIPLLKIERIASHLNFSEGTTALRLDIWEAGLAMGRDHPLFGVGLDSFLYYYPRYMLPSAWREPNLSHPHNLFLDFWLRMGIAGLALMLWLVIRFFITAYRSFIRETRPWHKALILGLMASMVDFVVHGMIDNSYFVVDLAVIFWFTLAAVRILDQERELA